MSCAKSSMINAYRGLLPTSFYQVLPVYKGGLMYHSVRYFTIFWFTFKSHLNWAKFLQWPIWAVHLKKKLLVSVNAYRGLLPTSFYQALPVLKEEGPSWSTATTGIECSCLQYISAFALARTAVGGCCWT